MLGLCYQTGEGAEKDEKEGGEVVPQGRGFG